MSTSPSPTVSFVTGSNAQIQRRIAFSAWFSRLCRCATYFAVVILAVLLGSVFVSSAKHFHWDFITTPDSASHDQAGILSGIWGTFWLIFYTGLLSIPLGVGCAIYLEEFASDSRLTRFIKINLSNLAGVPSIVYGILGAAVFVKSFEAIKGKQISIAGGLFRLGLDAPYHNCIITGALTMTLVILPVIIIASQEALRSVPSSIRAASLALGATRWQTVRHQVLPAAMPGVATGVILAISRAIGETAPLIMVGVITFARFSPGGIESPVQLVTQPHRIADAPFDQYTAMPVEIYNWLRQTPADDWYPVAASGIVVLLAVLLSINSIAAVIRYYAARKIQW
ncbi:MAG: phosphate ABC transporter permease PstA [Planctomycetaceae bacterium]|nr:phosphate ABC transporter permease PstA [Planctomycetaceae bacterium]